MLKELNEAFDNFDVVKLLLLGVVVIVVGAGGFAAYHGVHAWKAELEDGPNPVLRCDVEVSSGWGDRYNLFAVKLHSRTQMLNQATFDQVQETKKRLCPAPPDGPTILPP